ncbi:fungal-specific transcription factor domain-containing protein [Aspergillus avenaceus]|uniref:Fungal-specific transcription factor domain-containing protein n=1 Tax=Aspergillus avenaceus TaxID=36643 RepID=A0A5N6TX00_ASPAV|nr:fungal-specific transcription factor domain-containing protein [Aspergillus avenaceus]
MSSVASRSTQANPTRANGFRNDGPPGGRPASHRRSRSGCYTCRLRRKKCDETRPICGSCGSLNLDCMYTKPDWWGDMDHRQVERGHIKEQIRETKVMEKQARLQDELKRLVPRASDKYDFSLPPECDGSNGDGPSNQPFIVAPVTISASYPHGVNVQTEQRTLVHDSAMSSSFNNMAAPMAPMMPMVPMEQQHQQLPQPQPYGMYPTIPDNGWYPGYIQQPQFPNVPNPRHPAPGSPPLSSYLPATIHQVSDQEKRLVFHFVDHVLGIIFPILDVHHNGLSRFHEILSSLENNKSYYHCSLSVSAIHLKSLPGIRKEDMENDIMNHRFKAISFLCQSLNLDHGHDIMLDATLAMIFFHCSVGGPNDQLPDIPWNEHFTAVTNLANKLNLIEARPETEFPFRMSLTSWIDILGATMLGNSPHFAHTYRHKHLSSISSGLKELMGCEDKIMYLISEIACLDSLKTNGRLDTHGINHHVTALTRQLDRLEPADRTLEDPYNAAGDINADILTKNITAVFRVAARIYLYSLAPGFERNGDSTINLVDQLSSVLRYIPTGPYGFDRSLVWPLLITAVHSTQTSAFRGILAQRATSLGDAAETGSFGRMYSLAKEVWRVTDEPFQLITSTDAMIFPSERLNGDPTDMSGHINRTMGGQRIKKRNCHWRDVMKRLGWSFLLV